MNGKLLNLKGEEMSSSFTKKQLILLYQELDDLHRGALGFLLGNRFAAFKKANHAAYKKVNDELLAIQMEHCVMVTGEGKTLKDSMVIKMDKDENGELRPVMKPGKTLDGYLAAQNELLSKPCQILRPRPMDY